MNHFRAVYGLPTLPLCSVSVTTSCFELVNQTGTQFTPGTQPPTGLTTPSTNSAGWNIEESLDVDAVSSLCPLCKILMVEANSDDGGGSPDLETAVQWAGSPTGGDANQISMSFGGLEPASSSMANGAATDWSFGNASPLAAVGDGSYPGPPDYADNSYYWEQSSTVAPYVQYPAALSNVTAVGGTSLAAASNTRGFGESTWAIDTPCTFPWGTSTSCSGTESGCDTGQQKPSYQTPNTAIATACANLASSVGASSLGGRGYSDVSADADPNTGLDVYDSRTYPYTACSTSNWCVVGGTSLATPLAAAMEAVTGTSGGTPAWAYSDAADLNDIVSGSDGTCPSGATLLCIAGTGWDGPTGNGSISGDVVTGAPGIGGTSETAGGSASSPTATLTGGVYPNQVDTTYQWEWGTTNAYGATGSPTQATDVGAGSTLASASTLISGLTPCATYHYRLDATNADGTTYGYDNTFTAAQTAPSNTGAPTISGTPESGQSLTATNGTWSATACGNARFSYQWQESSSPTGTFTAISGATSSTYTPTTSDTGMYITVSVTQTNSGGSATATSQPVGPVINSTPPPPTTTATTTTPPTTTTGTTTTGKSTTTVQFYRCAHTCTLIDTHGATTYKLQPSDNGMYIELKVTTKTPGEQPIVTVRWIGPVTAPTAGNATIASAARVASVRSIKGTKNTVLARVQVTKRTSKAVTLAITPQGKVRTKVRAYVVHNGAVISCTATRTLKGRLKLTVALKKGQSVKLVALRAT